MNKNILIVFLILIIGVFAYFQFKPKDIVLLPIKSEQVKVSNNSATDKLQLLKDPSVKNYSGNNFTVEYSAANVYEDTATHMATLGVKAIKFFNGDPNSNLSDAQISYVVFIKDNISDNKTLDSFSKNLIKQINGNEDFPIDEKPFRIAERNGIQYSYKSIAGGYTGTVYVTSVIHNNKAYIIKLVDGTYSDYMKFISSFKFQ